MLNGAIYPRSGLIDLKREIEREREKEKTSDTRKVTNIYKIPRETIFAEYYKQL